MATLQSGERVPDFTRPDLQGRPVCLSAYRGQRVLLTFFRYATCPFCTMRFVRLAQEADRYSDMGVNIIGVFESSSAYIRQYLSRRGIPFPVIPDPDGALYTLFGVKKSVPGLMFGMFRMPTLIRALFERDYRMAAPDGSLTRIPADFLIAPDQIIADAYYGNDIGDHMPFRRIEKFVGQAPARNVSIGMTRP